MKATFEFEIKNQPDYLDLIMEIMYSSEAKKLNKVTLTCVCGKSTISERNSTTHSPEQQSDKDYDFMLEHQNCKESSCQTNKIN